MHPRVSVVVPAYNNAPYLASTLDSILAQDYDDYEVVVADHSSADSTGAILENYAQHARVRILAPTPIGGGALANWNRVSSHASGELLKLVCGDDLIAPTALREQVIAMDSNPSAVLVASTRDIVDANGNVVIRNRGLGRLDGLISGREAVRASVLSGTNIFGEPGCVLFRRGLLESEGGWDSTFPYLIDQATYTRIMLQGDMVALRKPLASFRISAGQWSVRLMKEQAKQAIAFHEMLRQTVPGLISKSEAMRGNGRALLMSVMRRAAYLWLRRRM